MEKDKLTEELQNRERAIKKELAFLDQRKINLTHALDGIEKMIGHQKHVELLLGPQPLAKTPFDNPEFVRDLRETHAAEFGEKHPPLEGGRSAFLARRKATRKRSPHKGLQRVLYDRFNALLNTLVPSQKLIQDHAENVLNDYGVKAAVAYLERMAAARRLPRTDRDAVNLSH